MAYALIYDDRFDIVIWIIEFMRRPALDEIAEDDVVAFVMSYIEMILAE